MTANRERRTLRLALGLCLLALGTSGCARISPDLMQASGSDYNLAMQRTSDEQMLLNLVRLKYRDRPFFLEVSAVSSQFRLTTGAAANASLRQSPATDEWGLRGSIDFTEQPTVSYAPLRGEDFVQRMLTPVPMDTLLLLYHSGWSVERVMRMTVQRINGIDNAPSASGPTPEQAPRYQEFLELAGQLRELQQRGVLDLGRSEDPQAPGLMLTIAPRALEDPAVLALERRLQLRPGLGRYRLLATSGQTRIADDVIAINTRSLMGVLFYLSQAVEIPEADRARGVVTVTRDAEGREFDWSAVTQRLFRIRYAGQAPASGAVRTRYRGHWFYIDDADLDTKSSFSLLAQLFSLQAGSGEAGGPVLTLPVGN